MGWWRVGWAIVCVGMGIVMPGPKPPEVVLGGGERAELERLVRAHTTGQQLAVRARVVLLAADGVNTGEVARALGLDVGTARQWRARWLAFREVPPCAAGAAERPADAGRPIGQWSARELAGEIVRRGITERLSPRHAARALKSGRPAAASLPLLAHPGGRGRRRGEDRRRV